MFLRDTRARPHVHARPLSARSLPDPDRDSGCAFTGLPSCTDAPRNTWQPSALPMASVSLLPPGFPGVGLAAGLPGVPDAAAVPPARMTSLQMATCHWGYSGLDGPAAWGAVCEGSFPTCAAGQTQSVSR